MSKDTDWLYLATTSSCSIDMFKSTLETTPDYLLYKYIKSAFFRELWSGNSKEKREIFFNYLLTKEDSFLKHFRNTVNRQYHTRFNKLYSQDVYYKTVQDIRMFVKNTLDIRAMVDRLSLIEPQAENTFVKL